MRLHETIRARRIELGMTQDQLARQVGVSAPAVNKWEKAASYPDITLLPVAARKSAMYPTGYTAGTSRKASPGRR